MSIIKPKAIIVDLDGTLCNAGHRLEHIQKKPKDWDAFFSRASLDSPNEWCLDLIKAFWNKGDYHIVFLTGRSESWREQTLHWLRLHIPGQIFRLCDLIMRPANDQRHDHIVKAEIYEKLIYPKYRVQFAIDDRTRICKMWREKGIVALQCDDWEDDALEVAQEIVDHFSKKQIQHRSQIDQTLVQP
jgi:HAD superfamily, subfamily IIIB (Acid phosphatase)